MLKIPSFDRRILPVVDYLLGGYLGQGRQGSRRAVWLKPSRVSPESRAACNQAAF